jgi:hypothetical protein
MSIQSQQVLMTDGLNRIIKIVSNRVEKIWTDDRIVFLFGNHIRRIYKKYSSFKQLIPKN